MNSDRDPFGITINGKTKEYLHAHDSIKGIIKKGKQFSVMENKVKILHVTLFKAMVNAIVEVTTKGDGKGNVELKVYNPSNNKKKGATIEMRKMSGYEYDHVLVLKNIVTILLDGLILGNDINQVMSDSNVESNKKVAAKVTSRPRLFSCDLCNWQTRFASALKVHKNKIHIANPKTGTEVSCDVCAFKAKEKSIVDEHFQTKHKAKKRNKSQSDTKSPSSSPPRIMLI